MREADATMFTAEFATAKPLVATRTTAATIPAVSNVPLPFKSSLGAAPSAPPISNAPSAVLFLSVALTPDLLPSPPGVLFSLIGPVSPTANYDEWRRRAPPRGPGGGGVLGGFLRPGFYLPRRAPGLPV